MILEELEHIIIKFDAIASGSEIIIKVNPVLWDHIDSELRKIEGDGIKFDIPETKKSSKIKVTTVGIFGYTLFIIEDSSVSLFKIVPNLPSSIKP